MANSPDRISAAVPGERRFRFYLFLVIPILTVSLLSDHSSCRAQTNGSSRFGIQCEMGYERSALNYNLLVADTSALSPDSLDQLHKSADTRTEPLAGLRLSFDNKRIHLNNGVFYTESGWREHFDGRAVIRFSPRWRIQANGKFDYHGTADTEDTLLVDYWTLTNDLRLLAQISSSHTISIRATWDRLDYPGVPPSFGYDFDRMRSRVGWSWQSDHFDFIEVSAGVGERFAPDSTDREYDERFIDGYSDIMVANNHRLLIDATIHAKDYFSSDPGDDYTLFSANSRWDMGLPATKRLSVGLRWDFWDFGAQDEVSFNFYELQPKLEFSQTLNDAWSLRFGPAYRSVAAVDAEYAAADYIQPSGFIGVEYLSDIPAWIDTRLELGRRNYAESSAGYTDYTILRLDASGDIDLSRRLTLSGGLNYEKEYHALEADDTDFLFFFLNLRYRLVQ